MELAEGVSVIDDVLAVGGVDTLEGRVGPLLFGETGRAHYLDMPAGSYVDEHAHDDEAFTLKSVAPMCCVPMAGECS